MARRARLGVYAGEVDPIVSRGKVGNEVVLQRCRRTVQRREPENVSPGIARHDIAACTAFENVTPVAADQRVGTAAAYQGAAGIVGNDSVVAASTDGTLNGRADRNADVIVQAADGRERPLAKFDRLGSRIARAIQRVGSAGIENRQRGRLGIGREIIDRAGGVVEAIDRIAVRVVAAPYMAFTA